MSERTGAKQLVISGPVRVDESVSRLVGRLEPGDIAVVEVADLDRSGALSLLAGRPAVVLNAASSTTGRRSSLGASLLVEGGIPVIDDMGADIMTLTEGERIRVEGEAVYRGSELIATGTRRGSQELRAEVTAGWARLQPRVESFAHAVTTVWEDESAQYLEGAGLPPMPQLQGRTVIVVGEGVDVRQQLKSLKAFRKDFSAFIVASGATVELVANTLRMPDIIVGDISTTPEALLRKGKPLVLLERPDGRIPGNERANTLALDYERITTAASPEGIAILLADRAGAGRIVTVGDTVGIDGFLEQPAGEAAAGFFIRTAAQEKLVSVQVVRSMFRPGISSWQLIWLLLAALLAVVVAALFTPAGGELGYQVWDWFVNLWPGGSGNQAGFAFWPLR